MNTNLLLSKIFNKEPNIWGECLSKKDINHVMGWLDFPENLSQYVNDSKTLINYMEQHGFKSIVLIGMGGSIMAARALYAMFDKRNIKYPVKFVDTVNPDDILSITKRILFKNTFFIISSKSGSTIETLAIDAFIRKSLHDLNLDVSSHMCAITEKNSPLYLRYKNGEFGLIFTALSTFGGRFSALSQFGLISILCNQKNMVNIVEKATHFLNYLKLYPEKNPTINLSSFISNNIRLGKNKLTILNSRKFNFLSTWIEQLVGESTGKNGKGIIPICGEILMHPADYGNDRQFVFIDDKTVHTKTYSKLLERLEKRGHPILKVILDDPLEIGAEFFKWQFAITLISIEIGIYPFDQPDVEFSKAKTKKILETYQHDSLSKLLKTFCHTTKTYNVSSFPQTDYVGLISYVSQDTINQKRFEDIRKSITKIYGKSVCFGIGPGYLHSVGQLFKGGPDNIFIYGFIDIPKEDIPVPNQDFTFGQLFLAQALGDFTEMKERGIPMNIKIRNK